MNNFWLLQSYSQHVNIVGKAKLQWITEWALRIGVTTQPDLPGTVRFRATRTFSPQIGKIQYKSRQVFRPEWTRNRKARFEFLTLRNKSCIVSLQSVTITYFCVKYWLHYKEHFSSGARLCQNPATECWPNLGTYLLLKSILSSRTWYKWKLGDRTYRKLWEEERNSNLSFSICKSKKYNNVLKKSCTFTHRNCCYWPCERGRAGPEDEADSSLLQ